MAKSSINEQQGPLTWQWGLPEADTPAPTGGDLSPDSLAQRAGCGYSSSTGTGHSGNCLSSNIRQAQVFSKEFTQRELAMEEF